MDRKEGGRLGGTASELLLLRVCGCDVDEKTKLDVAQRSRLSVPLPWPSVRS